MLKVTPYDVWEVANDTCGQMLDILHNVTFPEKSAARKAACESLEEAAELLEQTAQALRSRALEQRHPADGGNSPLPEDGASEKPNTDKVGGSGQEIAEPYIKLPKDYPERVASALIDKIRKERPDLVDEAMKRNETAAPTPTPRS